MEFPSSKLFSRSSREVSREVSRVLRSGVRPVLGVLLASVSLAAFAVAIPAQAAPIDVFFNGNRPASDPTTAFGISLASATNAAAAGVPIVSAGAVLSTIRNQISVLQPNSGSLVVTPNPPTAPQNRVESRWKIKNVSGDVLEGASYVLFTHTDPYSVRKTTIDYADENVGLRIDGAEGWVIIRTQSQGVDYYYPALLLGNDVSRRARVNATINYVVNEPLDSIRRGSKTKYYLPELQLGFAKVVIPEPGTALLFGFGLTILAAQRKRA